MAIQQRAPSIDMASIELRNSPAPTYTSMRKSMDWPLTPEHDSFPTAKANTSKNPHYQSSETEAAAKGRSRKGAIDDEESRVKADYEDANHPHYVHPPTKSYTYNSPPLPARSRWPRKRVLIPWILAIIFFLTTLWLTSVALGARFFSILHPLPSSPAVQEINVFIDGEALRGVVSI
ncbi:hypothetical protein EK21DRAFT_34532, partial [Setomelanomma holmii]